MLSDIRLALRDIRRSPGFVTIAVLSIALGIGANTAIFSLVNAILLRALPVRAPDQLVLFSLSQPDRFGAAAIPYEVYRQMRESNTALEEFAAFNGASGTLSANRYSEHVEGDAVSGNYFQALGITAAVGRLISPDDEHERSLVCVLSDSYWQRRFGADPTVIGKTVQIFDESFTIIGVAPRNFTGLDQGSTRDIFVALQPGGSVAAFGRLRRHVTATQAQASLDMLWHRIVTEQRFSQMRRLNTERVVLQPGSQGFGELQNQYKRPLLVLLVVVGFVLLIACANVTNLMMARASRQAKDVAIRVALGASRARLARQFLAESALLTLSGGALGILLSYWLDHALLAVAPGRFSSVPLILDVSPDWRVLSFTFGIISLACVWFGIAPVVRSTPSDLGNSLKGELGIRIPGRFSFTSALMILQVALSLILLIGAGLFVRSLYNLKSADLGFDPKRLVLLTVELGKSYPPAMTQNIFDRLTARAASLPGVVSAGEGLISPLSGDFAITGIEARGFQPRPNERPETSVNWVGPGYFHTLHTPLLTGRFFTEQDGTNNKVAIVNQRTAMHYWPNESPIGKHVLIGGRDKEDCEIVGVVKDIKTESPREEASSIVYLPFRQRSLQHLTLHVRVAGSPGPVTTALLREMRKIEPAIVALKATTMAAQMDQTIAMDRLLTTLMAAFSVLAVALAAVGLYGVMAFSVSARTYEIGVRMALGATPARILRRVVVETITLVLIGIALGLPAALAASRAIRSLLFGLTATDPSTYIIVALFVVAVSLSAAWSPARRAADVDPMVALLYE